MFFIIKDIMLIGDNITIRTVHGLADIDMQKIRAFLQGAVYSWCITRKDAGKILKGVLQDDNRVFETEGGYTRRYRWIN